MKQDEYAGQGGSFEIRDGKRVRIEAPTKATDTGGARDADGKPLPGTVPPDASQPSASQPSDQPAALPETAQPAARQSRKPAAE